MFTFLMGAPRVLGVDLPVITKYFLTLKGYSVILTFCFYDTTSVDTSKNSLFQNFQLLSMLYLQARHRYVHFIVPIEHCVDLILVDETLCKNCFHLMRK